MQINERKQVFSGRIQIHVGRDGVVETMVPDLTEKRLNKRGAYYSRGQNYFRFTDAVVSKGTGVSNGFSAR